jgi:uncharacterized protein YfdQ (DUF2303 family)
MAGTEDLKMSVGRLSGGAGSDAREVAELALSAAEPTEVDAGKVYAWLAPDGEIKTLDAERHGDEPRRVHGTVHPQTLDALVAYVTEHEDRVGRSTIWVDLKGGRVVAVLNDDDPGETNGWRDHRAELVFERTEPWKHWLNLNGRLVDQQTFAEHLEEGLTEIAEPDGASMLELAQSFHATTNATFRSARRLQSGAVQVQYDEEVQASAGASGELEVPTEFTLAVAPFVGDEPTAVTARLRFRAAGGTLQLGYKLERPEEVERQSLERAHDRLDTTFDHVYLGQPA